MRILHLVPTLGKASGGLGPAALGLARAQREQGIEADIWCLEYGDGAIATASDYALEHGTRTWEHTGPAPLGFSGSMLNAALSEHGRSYDLIHQHGIWLGISYVSNRWRRASGHPTVLAPHGALDQFARRSSRMKKWLAWWLYEAENVRSASCLHALSTREAKSFREADLANPVAIIPNGVADQWMDSLGNPEAFRRKYSIPAGKRVLLYLSRIAPIKGLPMLVEAASDLKDQFRDWVLIVAGGDERGHRREVESLVDQLGIRQLAVFVGPLHGTDKRDAFAAAELFILPTYSEGFPIVVLEALGAGVPVVTTKGAPCEEIARRGCGWWCDVEVGAIRQALADALGRSPKELRSMGRNGISLVREKYSWADAGSQSIDLYRWLLGKGRKPPFVEHGGAQGRTA